MAESIPFDQRLARLVVRPFRRTLLTPNQLTTLSLVAGLVAAALFAAGEPALAHWGAGAFMLAMFIDHTDGELARLTGKTSRFGHHYDYIVGSINYTALFIGIGVGLQAQGLGDWALVLGLAAGLANPLIVTLRMTLERVRGAPAVAHPAAAGFEIEDFTYLIGPITWVGGLEYFFIVYGLGTIGYLLWTISCFRRPKIDADG